MAQFKAMELGVMVSGSAVLSVVEAMEAYKSMALRILENHGIDNPKKDQWYPQQAWLDAFKNIADHVGPATLRMIGEKIPDTAMWPPVVNKVDEALASIDIAYHMNHRDGEIGHYRFEKTGEKTGKMICNNPYPCDFDFGIIRATSMKFAPEGTTPLVTHDKSGSCRRKGGNTCTYNISW